MCKPRTRCVYVRDMVTKREFWTKVPWQSATTLTVGWCLLVEGRACELLDY